MNALGGDVLCYIISFLGLGDRLSLRQTCGNMRFRVDNIPYCKGTGYTLSEELQRKRVSKKIYWILLGDVDTTHPMYIQQLDRYMYLIEDERSEWIKTDYGWRRSTRLAHKEESNKMTHEKICSWLLLLNDWISDRMEDKIAENDEFWTFWGYREEDYWRMEEASGQFVFYDFTSVKSHLPKWVIEELYPHL